MSSTNVLTRWFILDIVQQLTMTGYIIIVTTNVPCHLWMRWTNKRPWKHIEEFKTREVLAGKDYRFCFTVFENNEQVELTDTLVHTFIKEPWPYCTTRWFYFYGSIGGIDCPSESPILEKHRGSGYGWNLIEFWTLDMTLPDFSLVISEDWFSQVNPPDFEIVISEAWTS